MAKFRSLSDVIARQVKNTVNMPTAPKGTPLAYMLGQQAPPYVINYQDSGVFRWGISVWGIDSITGTSASQG